jgi:hypothetical protein
MLVSPFPPDHYLTHYTPAGIDHLHILTENGDGLDHLSPRVAAELHFLAKLNMEVSSVEGRFVVHNIGQRMTFADAFGYANANIQSGDIAIVANADIYFDETVQMLKKGEIHKMERKGIAISPVIDMRKRAFALLRWDVLPHHSSRQDYKNRPLVYHPRTDCQDSWVFQVPLPKIHGRCDFVLGRLRCDNRCYAHKIGF